MKILVYLVFTVTGIFCEVPPPYPSRGFRPSPQLALPQRTYGVPNAPLNLQTKYGPPPNNAEPLDPSFRDNSTPIKFTFNNAQNQYRTLPNNLGPSSNFNVPQRTPQTIYGTPKIINSQPQVTYGAPQKQQLPQTERQNAFQTLPQTLYGAPQQTNPLTQESATQPQRNYGAPDAQRAGVEAATLQEIRELKQLIQKIEAQRLAQQRAAQYAAPQVLQHQNSNFRSQDSSNRFAQSLPTRDASNFRNSLSDQYLPVKEPENFRKFVAPTNQFNPQESTDNNFGGNLGQNTNTEDTRNTPPFRGDQGGISPNNYIPPSQNNNPNNQGQGFVGTQRPSSVPPNFGNNPTNSWNNLDLPNGNPGNAQPNNGFSNSVPLPKSFSNVDVQKVEVTQFGSRNKNGNKNVGVGTTFRPQDDDFGTNGGRNEDEANRYIPPTVDNPVLRRPLPTTQRPFGTSPSESNYPLDQGDVTENPNNAVATAVAAPQDGQQFYLLQPDGTYQRVVVQKRGREAQTDNQYGANYLLQNLRTDPNIVYTPIIGLVGR